MDPHTHLYIILQARQQLLSLAIFYGLKQIDNRPFSYSQYWTGTNLQLKLMRGVFSNANGLNPFLNPFLFSRMNHHCMLVPVQYREYENRLLMMLIIVSNGSAST